MARAEPEGPSATRTARWKGMDTGVRHRYVLNGHDPLTGEMDMASADQLDSVVATAVSQGGPVTLDISNLDFMDSSGLHAILRAATSLTDRGCVVIHGLDGNVSMRRLFEIAQIDKVPNIHVIPCTVMVEGSNA